MDSIGQANRSSQPYLDTELLATFIAVADCRGFTAAARQLHQTQSTVSLRIRKLEEIVGVRLLARTSRVVSLTPEGITFLAHARRIVRMHAEAVAETASRGREGVIRFGAPEDYAERWVPAILDHFRGEFPGVRPDIHCLTSTELLLRLDRGELDLALVAHHGARTGSRRLRQLRLAWMAAPDFKLETNAPVPLALFPEGCIYRARAIAALIAQERPWQLVYTSQSPTGMRIAVDQKSGVTVAAPETAPASWRVLGPREQLPLLPPVDLELHRSPTAHHAAVSTLEAIAEALIASPETGGRDDPRPR